MSRDKRTFDLEERLIDSSVRIIRIAESLPKTKVRNHKYRKAKHQENFVISASGGFDIRYSKEKYIKSIS
jgi:hypothetical protein